MARTQYKHRKYIASSTHVLEGNEVQMRMRFRLRRIWLWT